MWLTIYFTFAAGYEQAPPPLSSLFMSVTITTAKLVFVQSTYHDRKKKTAQTGLILLGNASQQL